MQLKHGKEQDCDSSEGKRDRPASPGELYQACSAEKPVPRTYDYRRGSEDLNITIVSLASQEPQAATLPLVTRGGLCS